MNALEFNNQIANLISWITFNNNKHWDSIKNISTFKNGGHPNIS